MTGYRSDLQPVRDNAAPGPKLLHLVRVAIRRRRFSTRTEDSYVHWIKRFDCLHGKRYPGQLNVKEVWRD